MGRQAVKSRAFFSVSSILFSIKFRYVLAMNSRRSFDDVNARGVHLPWNSQSYIGIGSAGAGWRQNELSASWCNSAKIKFYYITSFI